MKKTIPFLLFSLLLSGAYAQTTIPNGTFESWVNSGQPTNWHSNKDGGGYATLGPQTCFQETSNPHSGTYCVKIESESYLFQTVNGSCTTGEVEAPTTNKADGYIKSESTNTG